MRPLISFSLLAVAFLFVSEASAQRRQPINAPPIVYVDHVPGHHALRADREDLRRIKDIARAWHSAVRRDRPRAEAKADRRLRRWLDREIEESRREVARREALLRQMGVQYGRRGGRWSYRVPRLEYEYLREARRDLGRTQTLARELHYLRHAHGRRYYAQKSAMLDELIRLERREVRRQQGDVRTIRRDYAWR